MNSTDGEGNIGGMNGIMVGLNKTNVDFMNEILKMLKQLPEDVWGMERIRKPTEVEIQKLEQDLGWSLPAEYKAYLGAFNGLLFPYQYIFCIGDGKDPYVFDIREQFEFYKEQWAMPAYFLPFTSDGHFGLYGFLMSKNSDGAVYHWDSQTGETSFASGDFCECLKNWIKEVAKQENVDLR